MNERRIIGCWLLLVFLGIALTVWPTRYNMERVSLGSAASVLVRIDRFTGKAEMLTGSGWRPMEESNINSAKSVLLPLPPDQVLRLEGRGIWCRPNDSTAFCIDLYNGTSWRVGALGIMMTAKNANGSMKWERGYIQKDLDISPFTTKSVYVTTLDNTLKYEWHLVAAKGTLEQGLPLDPKPTIDFGTPLPQTTTTPDEALGTLKPKDDKTQR